MPIRWPARRRQIAHINDVIAGQYRLEDYQILNFPGGWSFGDDLGSGKVFVNKLLYAKTPTGPLADQILKFIDDGKLVIGICNGFQILVKMGLLPAFDKDYKTQSCTLFFNDHGFRDSWVKLKVNQKSPCIFTKGIDMLDAPSGTARASSSPRAGRCWTASRATGRS